ncbi:MAG: RnfH family protein [Burkholderiaceae bacterium]|nr:RnfH family protein [Burkholderiaceae bacterium]
MSHGITVTVAYSPAARQVHEVSLSLPTGSTVRAAIDASGLLARYPDIQLATGVVGVWERKARPDHPLRDGDRVEIWRPLRVDPKLARRERFGKQGARAAGLFAKTRPVF